VSPYLKCRGPFIDLLGVPKLWFDYFTTRIKLHGQWGPRLKTLIHRGWLRLLGSRVLMWMVPGTVLGGCLCFTLLYLDARPSHVGADLDMLAYHLHHPIDCG
jgi:hypothetical protein